jgi:hypothetical protein
MVPVRAVAETLGYNVEWNSETKGIVVENLPQYYTFYLGTDGYTFAKTAPVKLGKEPVLIDGTTYVPVSFFTQIMDIETEFNENYVNFIKKTQETDTASVGGNAEITSVNKDTKEIVVEDEELGTIVLLLSDDVTDADGNVIDWENLSVGDKVSVVYSDVMTMSEPPVNNPVSITVQ